MACEVVVHVAVASDQTSILSKLEGIVTKMLAFTSPVWFPKSNYVNENKTKGNEKHLFPTNGDVRTFRFPPNLYWMSIDLRIVSLTTLRHS
jgi:hypothetical protein